MLKLKEKYFAEAVPAMKEKFHYKSTMAVPRIEKVVINVGFGRAIAGKTSDEQKKIYEPMMEDLTTIAGQKAVLTKAKKSIAAFKVRMGMPLGAKVTLRGQKMYDFLERLISVALPRSRDFRGIDLDSMDKDGNLAIGIKEHICFPEIAPEKVRQIFGFEIAVVTNAGNQEKGIEFLRLMGFPMKAEKEDKKLEKKLAYKEKKEITEKKQAK